MNLPGDEYYTPKLPRVMKVRSDGHLASEVFIYVDDGHIIAHSELVWWQAAKRFCSIFNSLGIQDASRKRTEYSLTPGPWAGTVEHTSNKEVAITVTHNKWEKTRSLVQEMEILMREDRVPHKWLECIRGLLLYVARNFKWMAPYLKVMHLTIDGQREVCDKYFYKIKSQPRVCFKVW